MAKITITIEDTETDEEGNSGFIISCSETRESLFSKFGKLETSTSENVAIFMLSAVEEVISKWQEKVH